MVRCFHMARRGNVSGVEAPLERSHVPSQKHHTDDRPPWDDLR